MHPFFDGLLNRLNAIEPGIHERLEELHLRSSTVGDKVLGELLSIACKPQDATKIVFGRQAIARISREWMLSRAPEVIETNLDLTDYWEYRRLLEVLSQSAPELLPAYIQLGLASGDADVREAAEDFS